MGPNILCRNVHTGLNKDSSFPLLLYFGCILAFSLVNLEVNKTSDSYEILLEHTVGVTDM